MDPPWLWLCCHAEFLLIPSSNFWIPHLLLDNHVPGSLANCILFWGPWLGMMSLGLKLIEAFFFKYTFLLFLFFKVLQIYYFSFKGMCACACSWFFVNELLPTRLLCPWNFQTRITRVGCHFLLHYFYVFFKFVLCLLLAH